MIKYLGVAAMTASTIRLIDWWLGATENLNWPWQLYVMSFACGMFMLFSPDRNRALEAAAERVNNTITALEGLQNQLKSISVDRGGEALARYLYLKWDELTDEHRASLSDAARDIIDCAFHEPAVSDFPETVRPAPNPPTA